MCSVTYSPQWTEQVERLAAHALALLLNVPGTMTFAYASGKAGAGVANQMRSILLTEQQNKRGVRRKCREERIEWHASSKRKPIQAGLWQAKCFSC